jgi:hypothetical protein
MNAALRILPFLPTRPHLTIRVVVARIIRPSRPIQLPLQLANGLVPVFEIIAEAFQRYLSIRHLGERGWADVQPHRPN